MKLNHHLLVILFLAILLGSCEDNHTTNPTQNKPPTEEQLPPITTTGAGTFGCKVNGKVWVAKSNKSWPHIYFAFDRANNNSLILSGNIINKPIDDLKVSFWFQYIPNSTNYIIGFNNTINLTAGSFRDFNTNIVWLTDSARGGKVTLLHFDSIRQIISGTFNFDCINKETGEVIKITEGRFDGNYTY
jgi:hypothetical protein